MVSWATVGDIPGQVVHSVPSDTMNTGQDVQLDELDARLIELLAEEPRIGVLECSRRLGVARGTVQARLDKLAAGVW